VASAEGPKRGAPPVRRGSRDKRREVTLQSFSAGREARCAYCGRSLPPIPSRGGRPTPYCPADPERYGQWGAKVITCAMLDECREIWVSTYGAEQPMTQVDVRVLDERAAALLAALDPVREEIAALRDRATEETTAALAAKAAAEQVQAHAEAQAGAAEAEKVKALAEAEQARQEAEASRTRVGEAEELAARAAQEKDAAVTGQRAAEEDKAKAVADRERALTLLSAAQETIAELQTTLAGERATALARLDQLRHEHNQAVQNLRTTLTEEHEYRLRARIDEFDEHVRTLRADADRRVAELNSQLAQATRTYADALGPLHEQLSRLRGELAERTSNASAARQQLDDLRSALDRALAEAAEDDPLRRRVAAVLGESPAATP
jgi:DNA repair exonuclease SbcCD ATPase subunit